MKRIKGHVDKVQYNNWLVFKFVFQNVVQEANDNIGLNKEQLTRAGFEPSTSGLMCRCSNLLAIYFLTNHVILEYVNVFKYYSEIILYGCKFCLI